MHELIAILYAIVSTAAYVFAAVLCLVGLLLSCLSISGTWLVLAACIVAAVFGGRAFPGFTTVLGFLYLAILVEVAEYVAGVWGVRGRGGSWWAALAAVVGGVVGLMFGGWLPLIGRPLFMAAGSFGLVYAVEYARLRRSNPAARIAVGAVLSRLGVLVMKTAATLGMIAWLWIGIALR